MTSPTQPSSGPARERWFIRMLGPGRPLRTFFFFVYYLAVILMLLWIYGRGDTPIAPFVYQGF